MSNITGLTRYPLPNQTRKPPSPLTGQMPDSPTSQSPDSHKTKYRQLNTSTNAAKYKIGHKHRKNRPKTDPELNEKQNFNGPIIAKKRTHGNTS